jgi:hypothetical protein
MNYKQIRVEKRSFAGLMILILGIAGLAGTGLSLMAGSTGSAAKGYATIAGLLTDNMESTLGLDEVPVWPLPSPDR